MKVAIVEDRAVDAFLIRELLTSILNVENDDIFIFSDEELDRSNIEGFDLVLVDYNLGLINGDQFIKDKALEHKNKLCLLISGYDHQSGAISKNDLSNYLAAISGFIDK